MQKAFVYILYSNSLDRFYTGFTVILPEERLERHIKKYYRGAWTRLATDWEFYWNLECENEKQAMKIERHIKRMKTKVYMQNLKHYPEIGLKLLEKYH